MHLPPEMCKLKITEKALNTALAYARLVNEVIGPYECIGFLGGDAGSDVVDTVILSPSQLVSSSRAEIDGEGVLAAGRALEALNKLPKGWWHSHGPHPIFHSAIDNHNSREVLNQIGHVHWTWILETLRLLTKTREGIVCLVDDADEVIELEMDAALATRLARSTVRVRRKIPVSIAYSLVVNANGDPPHAELYGRTWCKHKRTTYIHKQTVPITVVDTIVDDALREEIKSKVSLRRPPVAPKATLSPPADKKRRRRFLWRLISHDLEG